MAKTGGLTPDPSNGSPAWEINLPHMEQAQAIKSQQVQPDGQRVLALMALGKVCLGKGFICHDECLVCSVASGRHLAGVPELALLLCGVHQKGTIAIMDTPARWNSHVPWVLFLSEQSHE